MALSRWGPRFTSMFGCVVFAAGCAMLAASNLSFDWLHYCGYSVLAVGGAFVYVPSLQLCRIVPKLSSLMMAVMTSAFDVSAIVFFLMKRIYVLFKGNLTVNQLLGGYLIVPLVAFLLVTSFYPDGDLVTVAINSQQQRGARRHSTINIAHFDEWNRAGSEQENDPKAKREFSTWRLITSVEFWLLAIFTGCITSRFTHFIANFHLRMGQSSLAWKFQRSVVTGFTTFFPLGGFISLSAVGQLLQSFSLASNALLAWALIVGLWGNLEYMMTPDGVGAAVILCAILRPYYYSVTNQLGERLFGPYHYERAYGMLLAVAALINLLTLPAIYDGYFGFVGVTKWLVDVVRFGGRLGFILPIYLYIYHSDL